VHRLVARVLECDRERRVLILEHAVTMLCSKVVPFFPISLRTCSMTLNDSRFWSSVMITTMFDREAGASSRPSTAPADERAKPLTTSSATSAAVIARCGDAAAVTR
jgi:hypothetical protein